MVFIMDTLHKILDLMWKNNLSDADFCMSIGINKSAVTDWKKGKTKSYMKHIDKIAEFFNVTVDYLLSDEKKEPTQNGQASEYKDFIILYDSLTDEDRDKIKEYMAFLQSKYGN